MRMKKCGWQNADDKMSMEKCGWQITNGSMQMMKSIWSEMNLRCFLTVLLVNNPGHVIEFRPREVQYFFLYSILKLIKTYWSRPVKSETKTKSLDWIITDSTLFVFFIICIFSSAIRFSIYCKPTSIMIKNRPIVTWLTRATLSFSSSLLIAEGSLWCCYFAKSLLKRFKQWVWIFLNLFPSYVRVVELLSFPVALESSQAVSTMYCSLFLECQKN